MTRQLEGTYATLKELLPIISEPGYMFYGHALSNDSKESIDVVFEKGLSVDKQLICIDMPTPERKERYELRNLAEPTIENVESDFRHWQNESPRYVVILRLPIEYINFSCGRNHEEERYGAFYTIRREDNGNLMPYIDSKFVFGCYDVCNNLVKLNDNYEQELSDKTVKGLNQGFEKVLRNTRHRLNREKRR